MSIVSAAAQSCAQGCATAVNARWGSSYPRDLALLWPSKLSASGVLKSAKGPSPTFTDTPTLSAGGVVPGDGPSFTDVVTWADGGTRMMRFTASSASADLVGDVEIGGGFFAYSGGLKFKDGTNTAVVTASWEEDEVVTAVVQCDGSEMRVSDGTNYSAWVAFDGTMPTLEFSDTAPVKLLRVEEWSKVTPRPGLLVFDGETITWNGEALYWEGM
jgi:hypothetical protein